MSHHSECLNCNHTLRGKYCQNCGQKADTHRLDNKHFFFHDIVHGVFHVEKGILFTLLQAIKRPGLAARDYIAGKRVQYYNIFYLCLLLVATYIFIKKVLHIEPFTLQINAELEGKVLNFYNMLQTYYKAIYFSVVPIFAIASLLLFRRSKYNLAENCIISGFSLLSGTTIYILCFVLKHIALKLNIPILPDLFGIANNILFFIPLITYYQIMRPYYSLKGFAWRIIVFYVLTFSLFISLIIMMGLMS